LKLTTASGLVERTGITEYWQYIGVLISP